MLLGQLCEELITTENLSNEEIVNKGNRLISCYLNYLAKWCEGKIILEAQKGLMILSKPAKDFSQDVEELRSILGNSDVFLGSELGGFSRLFESILETNDDFLKGEIFDVDKESSQEFFDFRENKNTINKLLILYDICESFSVNAEAVFACLTLEGIEALLQQTAQLSGQTFDSDTFISQWVDLSSSLLMLKRIWPFRSFIADLSTIILEELREGEEIRAFCLWYLSDRFATKMVFEGFTRRLVDTLLIRAKLAPLIVFETAGLLP